VPHNHKEVTVDETPRAFVIMSFDSEFESIYTDLIVPPLEQAGYEVARADSDFSQQNILCDIVQGIAHADLVVAEITVPNPNVFYELGLAHALRMPTVLLTQSMDDVPFDLRSYRIMTYSTDFREVAAFCDDLHELAQRHREQAITFGSPITDFLDLSLIETLSSELPPLVEEGEESGEEPEVERGYLDYVVEGEEAAEAMVDALADIAAQTEDIGDRLSAHTVRINQLQESDTPGAASQLHRISTQAARDLREYSQTVGERVPQLEDSVDLFVESYSGFVGWVEPSTEEEFEALTDLRDTQQQMLDSARTALTNVRGMRDATEGLRGVTRDMNRASQQTARTLDRVISTFEKVEAFAVRTLATVDRKLEQYGDSGQVEDSS
jgi:hypothetical protein